MLVDAGPARGAGRPPAPARWGCAGSPRSCSRTRSAITSAAAPAVLGRSTSARCSTRCSRAPRLTSAALRAAARGEACRSSPRGSGTRTGSGSLRIRVLWPDHAGSPGEDPHLHGTVLLASYGSIDLLLTADAESDVTRPLPLRQVEVLKVAHHGSADPGLSDELRVLRPRVAMISVGLATTTATRAPTRSLRSKHVPGLRVYSTDEDGRIVLDSDGRTLHGAHGASTTVAAWRRRARSPSTCSRAATGRRSRRRCRVFVRVSARGGRGRLGPRRERRRRRHALQRGQPLRRRAARRSSTRSTGARGEPAAQAAGRLPTSKPLPPTSPRPLPTPSSRSSGRSEEGRARSARRARRRRCAALRRAQARPRRRWVAERFRQAGVKAETDACRAPDRLRRRGHSTALATEVAKIATWARASRSAWREIEQLVAPAPSCRLRAHGRLGEAPPARCSSLRDDARARRPASARHRAAAGGRPGRSSRAHAPLKRSRPRGFRARGRGALKMHPFSARRSSGRRRSSRTRSSRVPPSGSPSSIWR